MALGCCFRGMIERNFTHLGSQNLKVTWWSLLWENANIEARQFNHCLLIPAMKKLAFQGLMLKCVNHEDAPVKVCNFLPSFFLEIKVVWVSAVTSSWGHDSGFVSSAVMSLAKFLKVKSLPPDRDQWSWASRTTFGRSRVHTWGNHCSVLYPQFFFLVISHQHMAGL